MTRRDFLSRGGAVALLSSTALSACVLPRAGPLTASMTEAAGSEGLEGLVAPLTGALAETIPSPPPPGFPPAFIASGPIDPTRIGADDRLDITIWESAGAALLGGLDGGATTIAEATVDASGRVFVPFAGHVEARGATVPELRARIQAALEPLTLSPQVDVRLTAPRSRLVSVQGAVSRPGIYPIERATRRLSGMLAEAGGAGEAPERIEVTIRRGDLSGRQLLEDVLDDPALDIALRPGDLVVLSPIRERFIVLGAAGVQAELAFPTRPFDLLSAIGVARGLRDFDADPTGVFLFRYEPEAFAEALLPGPRPDGLPNGPGRPVVYRLDLSEPAGLFTARAFRMRDGDAIFVTNAPLTELRKFLQLFNAVVTPVNTVNAAPL